MIDSTANIHPTAIVHENAIIGKNVEVGPYTIIGDKVEIGDDCWIAPHVVIKGTTKIGKGNKIFQFSSIGEDCQDLKYAGEETFLEIGDNNVIRESCTIHRGTVQDQVLTKVGSNHYLWLMFISLMIVSLVTMLLLLIAQALLDIVILANNVIIGGHCAFINLPVLVILQ